MKQFRKYDETLGKIILDDNYLFAFTHSDGFSERLLMAELVMEDPNSYELSLIAFQHENKTQNRSDTFEETGLLPEALASQLAAFLKLNPQLLKSHYSHEDISTDDIGMQQILYNLNGNTIAIHIADGLAPGYFKSPEEMNLYRFNEALKQWLEARYQAWIL